MTTKKKKLFASISHIKIDKTEKMSCIAVRRRDKLLDWKWKTTRLIFIRISGRKRKKVQMD